MLKETYNSKHLSKINVGLVYQLRLLKEHHTKGHKATNAVYFLIFFLGILPVFFRNQLNGRELQERIFSLSLLCTFTGYTCGNA